MPVPTLPERRIRVTSGRVEETAALASFELGHSQVSTRAGRGDPVPGVEVGDIGRFVRQQVREVHADPARADDRDRAASPSPASKAVA